MLQCVIGQILSNSYEHGEKLVFRYGNTQDVIAGKSELKGYCRKRILFIGQYTTKQLLLNTIGTVGQILTKRL